MMSLIPLHHPLTNTVACVQTSFERGLASITASTFCGKITSARGLLVEAVGITPRVHLGSTVSIQQKDEEGLLAEVVGFREETVLLMAYGTLEGIRPGARVDILQDSLKVYPTKAWQGRVIDALGQPLDHKGPLPQGSQAYGLKASPPQAHTRKRTNARIDLGVKALNTFTTCCRGQRIGIFAGSGVGKSVLFGQITRFTECDVVIVGLIGERGREVGEFLEDQLGEDGLKRAIVVVATSDQPALLRRQAAYLTMTLAEYFRDQGLNVLCLMDSVTRFASAQREIGLSAGEPPTTRGFPPTVFSELPRLLERAGTTDHEGSITGIFTILVEGDDHNEPISDATRSILDGHIVLDRSIAEKGRYPAVNILKSLSRTMPDCNTLEETEHIQKARKSMAVYEDIAEMLSLGAYRPGSSSEVDAAIALYPKLNAFLSQRKTEHTKINDGFAQLKDILSS